MNVCERNWKTVKRNIELPVKCITKSAEESIKTAAVGKKDK